MIPSFFQNNRAKLVLSSYDAIGGGNNMRETAIRSAAAVEIVSYLLVKKIY